MSEIHPTAAASSAPSSVAAGPFPANGAGEGGTLFQREVDAAVERAGGARVRDERDRDLSTARRDRREAGFDRYADRVDGERRRAGETDEGRGPAAPRAERASDPRAPLAGDGPRAPSAGEPSTASAPAPDPSRSTGAPELRAPAETGPTPMAPASPPLPAVVGAPAAGAAPAAAPSAPQAGGTSAPRTTASASPATAGTRAPERAALPTFARQAPPGAAALERAEEILRQIRLATVPNAKRVVLELEPRDLGRMSIRMTLSRGELATVVRVESPQTLELLEQRSADLRALLAERGLDASRMSFELGFGAERRGQRRDPDPSNAPSRDSARTADPLRDPRSRRADPLPTSCLRSDRIDTYA